jgi:hypothetical protein
MYNKQKKEQDKWKVSSQAWYPDHNLPCPEDPQLYTNHDTGEK